MVIARDIPHRKEHQPTTKEDTQTMRRPNDGVLLIVGLAILILLAYVCIAGPLMSQGR